MGALRGHQGGQGQRRLPAYIDLKNAGRPVPTWERTRSHAGAGRAATQNQYRRASAVGIARLSKRAVFNNTEYAQGCTK